MTDAQQKTNDSQMSAITSALEAKPDVPVPDDFAARMMARLPEGQTHRLSVPVSVTSGSQFGRLAAYVSLVLLLAGMAVLAPRAQDSAVWLSLQGLLFLQFCALLLWAGMSRRRLL